MKILIIGGTGFLGRHYAEIAQSRGHELTLFNRGQRNPGLFPEAEHLRGDRDGGLDVLKGRRWDVVLDTCGFVPRLVSASARLLADACEHYTFVSSCSVYDLKLMDANEESPVLTMEDESLEDVPKYYGELKALCEKAAEAAMPGRVLHVRAGLIVGPYDASDRFTYWPVRLARGGEVLAPGRPDKTVQFIDVRDLATFMLNMAEQRKAGIYNVTSPKDGIEMEEVLSTCRAEAGTPSTLTWVADDFLKQHEVGPWVEMPLWLPDGEADGLYTTDVRKALAEGLTFRPVADTVRDVLAWHATLAPDRKWRAGLAAEKEARILEAWHKR